MGILDKVILGIHDGHDAAAAIVRGGKILCAVSEERIARVKSAGGFPVRAIKVCLDHAGLTASDIDLVALAGTRAVPVNMLGTVATLSQRDHMRIQEELRYPRFYENKEVPFASLFPNYEPKADTHYPRDRVPLKETQEMSPAERKEIAKFRIAFIAEQLGLPSERVVTLDHHRCHAYYAYYASPFRGEPIAALTMDAGGDGVYDSVNFFDAKGKFTRLHASHDCIIGPLYSCTTLALGMRPNEHEYKVMGLAPYAKEHVKKFTRETFLKMMRLDGIRFSRSPEVKDFFWYPKELLKYERFDGIAGGLQDFVEHYLTQWVANAITATGARKVVFAGGVSLNVKANQRIAQIEGLESLFVPPGPGDESLSIGAAWALMDRLNRDGSHRTHIDGLSHAYLGPDFGETDLDAFRSHPSVKGRFEEVAGNPDELACDALENEEIVAVCRGRMEFGPRALGHRSLLAKPHSRKTVKRINEAIKGRDFWMPFAPSILAENVDDYCLNNGKVDLSYMTVCLDSTGRAQREIPATLHPYDETARVHAVRKDQAPDYHALLSRFRERTGIGGVLNTSLNIHGKPIVMRPVEIAEELLGDEKVTLDCLLIQNRFFRRRRSGR